jgi:hypothetical protein
MVLGVFPKSFASGSYCNIFGIWILPFGRILHKLPTMQVTKLALQDSSKVTYGMSGLQQKKCVSIDSYIQTECKLAGQKMQTLSASDIPLGFSRMLSA